jgi:hypothetical protein
MPRANSFNSERDYQKKSTFLNLLIHEILEHELTILTSVHYVVMGGVQQLPAGSAGHDRLSNCSGQGS